MTTVGLQAQDNPVRITHLTQEDGLPGAEAYEIVRDARGLMWFGLREAIASYDGYDFKIWTRKMLDLEAGHIANIYPDVKGNIWFYPRKLYGGKGLKILDTQTGVIQAFDEKFAGEAPFKAEDIYSIMPPLADKLTVWIVTFEGDIYRYDGKFRKFFSGMETSKVAFRVCEKQNGYFISRNDKLIQFSRDGRWIDELKLPYAVKSLSCSDDGSRVMTNNWEKYLPDEDHKPYPILIRSGLPPEAVKLHYSNGVPFNAVKKYDIVLTGDGEGWLYGGNLIVNFNAGGEIQAVYQLKDEDHTLKIININDLFIQGDRVIWATTNNGIFKIVLRPREFQTWLPGHSCRGILKIGNQLLVNTYLGDRKIDLQSNKVEGGMTGEYNNMAFATDDAGNLWIGTEGGILLKTNLLTLKTDRYKVPDFERHEHMLLPFHDKITGRIWVGMNTGLSYLDPVENVLKRFNAEDYPELETSYFRHFYRNREGLWMATSQGLFLMNDKTDVIQKFSEKDGLPDLHIYYIYEDADRIFWLGTKESGLVRWDRKKNEFQSFTTEQGLSNNTIHCIYEDQNGQFWMSSDYGLMRFDKSTYVVNTLHVRDGLPHDEFNFLSYYRSEDGTLFFGGLSGVISFHPDSFIFEKNYDLPLLITDFRSLNSSTGKWEDQTVQLLQNGRIMLKPEDASSELRFALLDYTGPNNTNYAWKIVGFSKDWNYQKSNLLNISRLPYGKYSLRIRAQGSNGQWSSSEISLPLFVVAPFYLRTWFIALCTAGLALLIFGWVKLRTYNLRRDKVRLETEVARRTAIIEAKKAELESLNATKDRLFAIIAHDLRSPALSFRGIAQKVNYLIKKGEYGLLEKLGSNIESNAQTLNHLLDNLLDWSLGQGKLQVFNPHPLPLNLEVKHACSFFEQKAADKGIQLIQSIPPDMEVFADQRALATGLRNLLDNAVKFTEKEGRVEVSAREKAGSLVIKVKDTGVGISPERLERMFDLRLNGTRGTNGESGSGLGLTLVKDLMEKHGGELMVESTPGRGTTVSIIFPKIPAKKKEP